MDAATTVNIEKIMQHCLDTMIHIALHLPWVQMSPSVHQMLAHNWELVDILEGKPIAVWSESGLEAWNKHVRNFRSGAGCRARQNSVQNNIHDIFVRMLVTSSPVISKARSMLVKRNRQNRTEERPLTEEETIVQSMYEKV